MSKSLILVTILGLVFVSLSGFATDAAGRLSANPAGIRAEDVTVDPCSGDGRCFISVRSISGEGKLAGLKYLSVHELAEQAALEACNEAVGKCERAMAQPCGIAREKNTLGATGYLAAPADFYCISKTKAELTEDRAKQSVLMRIFRAYLGFVERHGGGFAGP